MIATYRLQLEPSFGFGEVERIVPYLNRLGVSHLYLSPITEARSGSMHGYDVIDHNVIREELGGKQGWEKLSATLRDADMKVIIDFVPNHAGVGPRNEAWQNVLAFGQHSPFASYFDIDWNPLEDSLKGKVLLPFLGKPYGECLDEGEIQLIKHGCDFRASYGEHNFALSPITYANILAEAMTRHERTDLYFDLKELRESYASLSAEDVRRAEMLSKRLDRIAEQIEWQPVLAHFSQEKLHQLLEQQNWRLAYWKAASYEINYRRFFDVNGLFALRVQDKEVFWNSHQLVTELLGQPEVDGLRIDHIDGLFDPQDYLHRLQDLGAKHVWVEKILAAGETLPEDWIGEGTTGYEFMNDVMNVLVNPSGLESIQRTYHRFVQDNDTFEETVRESKRLAMETALSSELHRLAYGLNRLCKADYHTRDFAMGALRKALAELIAAIDRYRTYLPYGRESAEQVIEKAVQRARQRTPSFEPSIYDFISKVILGDLPEKLLSDQQAWVGRFQQYCSAVAAKGVEDTSFYRFMPLVALNEVGGQPSIGEQPLQAFHSHARFRARYRPLNLLATATHDHKRGEDTRMRLIALTEIADQWDETVHALAKIGEAYSKLQGASRHDQYLFFQVLVALWDNDHREDLTERMWSYMQKATRESKRQTSWNNENADYEQAVERFVRGVIADPALPATIEPLCSSIARLGFQNALTQLVLKFTSPGVPDIYQGSELMDLSLVDPDNRRPVDYAHREQLLSNFEQANARIDALEINRLIDASEQTVKLLFMQRLMKLRSEQPAIFELGSYRELNTNETDLARWIAFVREYEGSCILVLVPRLQNTKKSPESIELNEELQGRQWTDTISGQRVEIDNKIEINELPCNWVVLHSGV